MVEYKSINMGEGYVKLFQNIFGYWDDNQRPHYIIVGYIDGAPIGFASFIRTHIDTLYLQYTGLIKEATGKQQWKFLEGSFKYFTDIKYIVARISNNNTVALITALKIGWKIIGFRSTTLDKSLVEVIKEI